eukprot:1795541-Pyramimonas_sp.AAC.2
MGPTATRMCVIAPGAIDSAIQAAAGGAFAGPGGKFTGPGGGFAGPEGCFTGPGGKFTGPGVEGEASAAVGSGVPPGWAGTLKERPPSDRTPEAD